MFQIIRHDTNYRFTRLMKPAMVLSLVMILISIGVDPSLIAIIIGVDRILDMCRTTLNVTGDIAAAAYVARSEGYPLLDEAEARA